MKTLKLSAPEPDEAAVQAALVRRLRASGWMAIKINGGSFKSSRRAFLRSYIIYGLNASAGFPDILALRGRGGLIEARLFEVKRRGGVLSAPQQRFIEYAAAFKIPVVVVDGWADMERVTEQFK